MIIKSGCLLAASVRFMHKIFMARRNCVRLCFCVCVSGLFDKKKFRVALLISRWEMYCISPSVLLQHTRWIHAPRSFFFLFVVIRVWLVIKCGLLPCSRNK